MTALPYDFQQEQKKSILNKEEIDSSVSTIESILAGIGSGLIQIPKGVVSLGASLMDLGADTNKAAQVEKWFDDLTTWDEKAQATAAGKITELLINIGIPGGVGFKIGTKIASQAVKAKRAGTYFKMTDEKGKALVDASTKAFKLNKKGKAAKFIAGATVGGAAEGVFIGDVDKAGTFGDLFGGLTALDREKGYDPARELVNRIKFGTEGALFTGLFFGVGKTLKTLAKRGEDLRYSDDAIDRYMDKLGGLFRARGKKTKTYFTAERETIGKQSADVILAKDLSRGLNKLIDGVFPYFKRSSNKSTKGQKKELLKKLNDALISGTPSVGKNGIVKFGKMERDAVKKFFKKQELSDENLAGIFTHMQLMRNGWEEMFSALGQQVNIGVKQKILNKGAFKEFKNLFGNKFKNYLSSTYDVFQNKSLIPLFNYKPSEEVVRTAIAAFRAAAKKNGTKLSYEEAESYVNNIVKNAQPPKNFKSDVLVKLPDFFTGKTLAKEVDAHGYMGLNLLKGPNRELIEQLLGKTADPIGTMLNSTGKISAVTRSNEFLNTLLISSAAATKAGKRALLYSNEADAMKSLGRDVRQIQIKKHKQAGITNPAHNKWALNETAEAIEAGSGNTVSKMMDNAIYNNLILYPKATSQIAKTILSPVTHARNFISAMSFALANGIIPGIGMNPKIIYNTFKTLNVAGLRQQQAAYKKLVKLGVVNTNVRLGQLRDLMRDVDFGSVVSAERGLKGLLKPLSKLKKWTEDMYTAEDDFWKIGSYAVERNRLANAYARAGVTLGKNSDEVARALDEEAASIIRNNIPNYDYVSDTVKSLRRFPVGNFVAFPSEIIRTGTNIVSRALHEISHTVTVGGKKIKPLKYIGMQRLVGMGLTTAAVPYAATKLGQTSYDITDEQRDAIKTYVAEWSKNSTIVPTRFKDPVTGEMKFSYIDYSHANAYDTLVRPIQTVLNEVAAGEKDNDGIINDFIIGALKGLGETAQPFVSESIWTEALMDVSGILGRGGVTIEGYKIYNPEDSAGNIAKRIGLHLLKAQAPLSWQQLQRLDYAVGPFDTVQLIGGIPGKFSPSGETYEWKNELLGMLGLRSVPINVQRSLNYKIANYNERKANARGLFTRVTLKGGPVTPETIVDAYLNANRASYEVQKDMHNNINAAKILNTPRSVLKTAFKRVPKKEYRGLDRGVFNPYEVSRTLQKQFYINASRMGAPNPYAAVRGIINSIRNRLKRLRTFPGMQFPDFKNPFKNMKLGALPDVTPGTRQTQTAGIQTPTLDASNLAASATQTGHVNPATGLTRTETALLSRDEQAIRQNQRGLT
jgi:hypothetical protein